MTPREQVLCDILTTAVEGGITYWCNEPAEDGTQQVERIERDTDLGVTAVVFNRRAVEEVSGARVLAANVWTATTVPADDEVVINHTAIARALRAIIDGKVTFGGQPLTNPNSSMRKLAPQLLFATSPDDAPDYDAGDADNLLQAALFGDVIYG